METAATAKRPAGQRHGQGPRLASALVAAAFVFYTAQIFRMISQYAVNIFFWDEWDLKDATLFEKYSLWQMFVSQHWWHRLGVGAWIEKLVNPPFHWNSRAESFILGVILTLTAICAVWLKTRLDGGFSAFDVVIPAIFFTPAQWELLYGSPIFSQAPIPTLLIMLYCLSWTCEKSAIRYPLVLLINFLTIYTGFGLFLGAITPPLLVLDHYSRARETRLPNRYFLGSLVVSLLSMGSFFVGYRPHGGMPCSQKPALHSYISFFTLIWAHFFGFESIGFFPRLAGKICLVFLLVGLGSSLWLLVPRYATGLSNAHQKRRLMAAGLMTMSLLTCVTISYSRLCGGLPSALAPRYAVYVQLGVLGLYFYLLSMRPGWSRSLLLVVFGTAILAASLHVDRAGMAHFRDIKERWKTCYLQTEDINRCDQVAGFPMHPRPEETHLREKLQFLKQHRLNLYADAQ